MHATTFLMLLHTFTDTTQVSTFPCSELGLPSLSSGLATWVDGLAGTVISGLFGTGVAFVSGTGEPEALSFCVPSFGSGFEFLPPETGLGLGIGVA